jgi:hypothetical protein
VSPYPAHNSYPSGVEAVDGQHRTAPDSTGQYRTVPDSTGQYRTVPDISTHDTVQNGPDISRTCRTTKRTFRTTNRTPDRTRSDTKPDIDRTLTGHYRTLPDRPDNRTPTAQVMARAVGGSL